MKIIRRIIAIILIIFTILTSPLAGYFNIENNAYASTFTADIESEMFKQTVIPLLISAGLVFKSKEAVEEVVYELKDWLYDQGFDWQLPPDPDPEDPKLGDMIKALLASSTMVVWNAAEQIYQSIVNVPQWFWEFISTYVNNNYDEGENISYGNFIDVYTLPKVDPRIGGIEAFTEDKIYLYSENMDKLGIIDRLEDNEGYYYKLRGYGNVYKYPLTISLHPDGGSNGLSIVFKNSGYGSFSLQYRYISSINTSVVIEMPDSEIIGISDIVDNPDYDWNNQYTGDKDIVIPIQSDIYGNPLKDDNGYFLPSVETEDWVDVQPEEIPLLDPSGVPQPDIPEIPEHDEEDSKEEGILITIATILATLLSKITGIKNDTSTMVEKMPETSTGGTGGIDTSIPTGFEWGDFRRFFDVIFIFIYFIVILILILLKFLEIVFLNLVAIPANSALLDQYPTILAGVNYVKNLQVGGLSITVHQAFEYIFLIFFFIFIIKQIRKLYGAFVFEENERERDARRDMKMDYYDKNNNVR